MGNPMTRSLVRPHGRAGAVTPLLRFLAGAHGESIALAWPCERDEAKENPGC